MLLGAPCLGLAHGGQHVSSPPADPTVGQEQRGDVESARGSLGDVQEAGDH